MSLTVRGTPLDLSAIPHDAACLIVKVDEAALAHAPKAEQEALADLLELVRDTTKKPCILIPPGWTIETATLEQLLDLAACCLHELRERQAFAMTPPSS